MSKSFHVGVAGTGMVLPKTKYTNDDIIEKIKLETAGMEGIPELNSQWIEENIWIKQRYFFGEDESLVDVSTLAVQKALDQAGWDANELDFVVLSSISFHAGEDTNAIPSAACVVQEKLAAYNAFAYNTSAACSGWVYGMGQGIAFIESGMAKKGVVICAEKQQYGLNFKDHRSSILIGDVATATLLEATPETKTKSVYLHANDDKKLSEIIKLPFHGSAYLGTGHFSLQGKQVFKAGIMTMTKLTLQALQQNQLTVEDVDWFIYHQANGAMLRMVGQKVGMADEKNLMNIQELANTTAGTIPSVLHMYIENGTIKRGDKICCIAFGGGLTSGSVVFEY